MYADRYSRMIAWLKVSLPILALAILSTLFLIARVVDPPDAIPFADTEVQKRLETQQISGPYFSGISSEGDQIEIYAEVFSAASGKTGENSVEDVRIRIDFAEGHTAQLQADKAVVNIAQDTSELSGNVRLQTSHGYTLSSERFVVRMSSPEVNAPSTIVGKTPAGSITAGAMRFDVPEENGRFQLVFTNGVKLLFQPKNEKE